MKHIVKLLAGACTATLLSVSAFAQMGSGVGMGGMGQGPRPMDCSKAPDKAQCEAHNKALAVCGQQRGPAHRECMEDQMPAPDCSKAPNPANCATMQSAQAVCKGLYGPDRAKCMREKMPTGAPGGGMGPGKGMGPGAGMGMGMGGVPPVKK